MEKFRLAVSKIDTCADRQTDRQTRSSQLRSPTEGGVSRLNTVLTNTFKSAYIMFQLINKRSVSEWLACWTQAQKGLVLIAVATLTGNSLRQTVHTHCASVHQAAKLVAALLVLRVARVTAGLAESNDSLPPGL